MIISTNLFHYASVIRCNKTAALYVIVLEPGQLTISPKNNFAYAYRAINSKGKFVGMTLVMSCSDMENGSFALIRENYQFEKIREDRLFKSNNLLNTGKPDLSDLLRLSSSRYKATYMSLDGEHVETWDCSGFLCSNYALADFWDIVQDGADSFFTDGLREDENAPDWVKDAEEGWGIVTIKRYH